MPIKLERQENIFILQLGDDENRFDSTTIEDMHRALDDIEHAPGPKAMVSMGIGKFYSNGLDLSAIAKSQNQAAFLGRVDALLIRVMTLPCLTAAAINGHAFGAGAILALTHDYRFMRFDRGYFCLPEIDLNMSFTPVMNALLEAGMSRATFRDTALTGVRLGGENALQLGIIDQALPQEQLLNAAIEKIAPLAGKAGATMGAIKQMKHEALTRLWEKTYSKSLTVS